MIICSIDTEEGKVVVVRYNEIKGGGFEPAHFVVMCQQGRIYEEDGE